MKGLQKIYAFLGFFESPSQTKPFFKASNVWVLFALYLALTVVYKVTGFALVFSFGLPHAFFESKFQMIRLSILLMSDAFILLLAGYALFLIFTSYYKFLKCCLFLLMFWLLKALLDSLALNVVYFIRDHYFEWAWGTEGVGYPVFSSVLFIVYCKYHHSLKAALKHFFVRKPAGKSNISPVQNNNLSQENLTGVKGWLLVIAIHLAIMCVYNTHAFFSAYVDLAGEKTSGSSLLLSKRAITFFSGMVCATHIVTALAGAIALMTLFMRKKTFKGYYYAFIGSSFLFPVVVAAGCFWFRQQMSTPMLTGMLTFLFAYPVALIYLAQPYLTHSKRVRLTLVN
ncbi:hypothetical protein QMS86_01740 [Cronobacter dublinensis]|uniref:hypothetical protein n=1 Tax=Cronobacter dublinensis TaxID=413497 RepID=UPI003AE4307A